MIKKFLVIMKAVIWLMMCAFAGNGAGNLIKEEYEKKHIFRTILASITLIVLIIGNCSLGGKIGEDLYDEWIEADEEEAEK